MTELRIDVERFVSLTLAMAAASCAPSAPTATAPPTRTIIAVPEPVETPDPVSSETPVEPPQDPSPPVRACDNDVGEVSCSFIDARRFSGPACEGFDGSCGLLQKGYGYRKRVAAAAARCWEERGTAACDIKVRERCNRRALNEACPDASYESFCLDTLARCKTRGQRPDFSVAECVKALSALEGGNLEWAKSAIGPSGEGCRLMFPVY